MEPFIFSSANLKNEIFKSDHEVVKIKAVKIVKPESRISRLQNCRAETAEFGRDLGQSNPKFSIFEILNHLNHNSKNSYKIVMTGLVKYENEKGKVLEEKSQDLDFCHILTQLELDLTGLLPDFEIMDSLASSDDIFEDPGFLTENQEAKFAKFLNLGPKKSPTCHFYVSAENLEKFKILPENIWLDRHQVDKKSVRNMSDALAAYVFGFGHGSLLNLDPFCGKFEVKKWLNSGKNNSDFLPSCFKNHTNFQNLISDLDPIFEKCRTHLNLLRNSNSNKYKKELAKLTKHLEILTWFIELENFAKKYIKFVVKFNDFKKLKRISVVAKYKFILDSFFVNFLVDKIFRNLDLDWFYRIDARQLENEIEPARHLPDQKVVEFENSPGPNPAKSNHASLSRKKLNLMKNLEQAKNNSNFLQVSNSDVVRQQKFSEIADSFRKSCSTLMRDTRMTLKNRNWSTRNGEASVFLDLADTNGKLDEENSKLSQQNLEKLDVLSHYFLRFINFGFNFNTSQRVFLPPSSP